MSHFIHQRSLATELATFHLENKTRAVLVKEGGYEKHPGKKISFKFSTSGIRSGFCDKPLPTVYVGAGSTAYMIVRNVDCGVY